MGEIARAFDVAVVSSPKTAFDIAENSSPKPGDGGLKLLEAVSNVISDEGIFPESGGAEDEDEDCRYSGHHVLQSAGG